LLQIEDKVMKRAFLGAVFCSAVMTLAATQALAQSQPPLQKPDIARGQAAAAVCMACHGADGNSPSAAFPKLAGQHYDYIVKQLNNFKVKPGATKAERENTQMAPFAASLSEQQIRDLAAFYAAQKKQPAVARNKDSYELGKQIYRAGIAAKNVPACAACHGPAAAGIPAQYPRLGGQWAEYTEAQMIAFRQGTRLNNAVMSAVAARMSDAEIKAVSDYIAGLR
jgi:cytochrome c553